MKNNRGITLIALIITIIVLIILVAVTVAMTLEGGLFSNAKKASEKTEQKAISEIILGSSEYNNNGELVVGTTRDNAIATLSAEYEKVEVILNYPNATNPTFVELEVKGRTGTYYYEISGVGIKPQTVEKDEEDNTILTGGINTYVITSEEDNQTGEKTVTATIKSDIVPEDTWYILTDSEKAQLLPLHMQPAIEGTDTIMLQYVGDDGSEVFMIACDTTGSIMYLVEILDLGNNETAKLYTIMDQVGEYMYINMSSSDYAKAQNAGIFETNEFIGMPPLNTWMHNDEIYTGTTCPEKFSRFATEQYSQQCFCPTYLQRIMDQFDE